MTTDKNQRGAVAIMVALMMVVLLGFLGLAMDVSYYFVKRTQLQGAADAEVLACVVKSGSTCPVSSVTSTTDYFPALTAPYNFTSKLTVNTSNPGNDTLCPSTSSNGCSKVTMSDTWNTFFIPIFGIPTLTSTATAIAGHQGSGQGCVIATSSFSVKGSQGLNGSNCSNYFADVSVKGNPSITGSTNYVYNGNPASDCSTCSPAAKGISTTLTAPPIGGTVYQPTTPGTVGPGFTGTVAGGLTCPGTTCTLSPGVYTSIDCSAPHSICNLVPTGSATASQYTFEFTGSINGPGNNGSLTGNGVVVYFGGNGSITMGGGGTSTFSSPVTGSCSGTVTGLSQTVFYGPNLTSFTYGGNSALNLTGNIYMPNASFALSGNGGITQTGTMVISSYSDSGGGNSGLTINGAGACGFSPNGSGNVILAD